MAAEMPWPVLTDRMKGNISVYCLRYGQSVLAENLVFVEGDPNKTVPISFCIYLICTADKKILVDAGCDTMPGFEMKDFSSPADVLTQEGISPKEITDVVITHAHHDHIEAVRHFENAVIHITEEAYDRGKHFIPEGMTVHLIGEEYVLADGIKMIK